MRAGFRDSDMGFRPVGKASTLLLPICVEKAGTDIWFLAPQRRAPHLALMAGQQILFTTAALRVPS